MTNKAAAEILSSADFSSELEKLTKANGRQVKVRRNSLGQSDMMSINFVNLPPGVGSAGGGAEAENNRALFFVDGWDKKDENAPAPTGKVKVEMSISLYAGHGEKQPKKFRAKTGTPEFRVALKEALETMGEVVVPQGVLRYTAKDHFGLGDNSRMMLTIQNGNWKALP